MEQEKNLQQQEHPSKENENAESHVFLHITDKLGMAIQAPQMTKAPEYEDQYSNISISCHNKTPLYEANIATPLKFKGLPCFQSFHTDQLVHPVHHASHRCYELLIAHVCAMAPEEEWKASLMNTDPARYQLPTAPRVLCNYKCQIYIHCWKLVGGFNIKKGLGRGPR